MKHTVMTHPYPHLEEQYHEIRHPSGLTVLVCPKALSTYYATLGVRFGALDGLQGDKTPRGVAHFLEHKMFEGADGTEVDRVFSALGAEVNAFTSYERTAYQCSCTDGENFSAALEALLQMVLSLTVTEASVKRERRIIAEEIRMNGDSPYERCYAELIRALYVTHGVREEICGTRASINRITAGVLRDHYQAYYRPDRMMLAVCGPVAPEDVMAVVDGCLSTEMPVSRPVPVMAMPTEPGEVRVPDTSVTMGVAKPLFCLGVKDPEVPTAPTEMLKKDVCMTVLCEMLFSCSGELYRELFEAGAITPGWSYGSSLGRGYAFHAVSGEADDPIEVYARCKDYLHRMRREGLSREDFERSRRVLYADYVIGLDAAEDVAESMLSYAMDGLGLYDLPQMVQTVTFEDICRLFDRSFTDAHVALSVVWPENDEPTKRPEKEK